MSYPTDLQNVAIYLRKSRQDVEAEARGEGETLSKHRRALLQISKKYHYVIKHVYEEVVSGERILERPQMQALLSAVQEKRYEAILCMDIDRLGRGNMIDQGLIQDVIKNSGALIITPRKVYDLRDEMDEEWSEFEAFIARRELKVINRRLQRGRQQSASEGKSISAKPPYGYSRGQDLKLHPDPQTAPTVQLIFKLAAEGRGVGWIANYLTDHKIKTPSGNDLWLRSSVHHILNNPVYLGHVVWGRIRYRKTSGVVGYQKIRTEKQDWISHENAHEPLIEIETYLRYQDHLKKIPKISSNKELINPLASLVYCGKCGRSMRFQKTYGRPTNRLTCKTHNCKTRSSSFEMVEQKIFETLRVILHGIVAEQKMQSKKKNNEDDMLKVTEKMLIKLKAEIEETEKQRSKLHDFLEQGIYNIDTFIERNQILGKKIEELQKQHEHALNEMKNSEITKTRRQDVVPSILRVMNAYELAQNPKAKNDLLKSIIDRVIFRREPDWSDPDHFEVEIFLKI